MASSSARLAIVVVAVLIGTFLAPAAGRASLVGNGSFEVYQSPNFTGWTKTGSAGPNTNYGNTGGIYAVGMNGSNLVGNAVLTQTLTTVPGTIYDFEFDYGVYGAARTQQLRATVTGNSQLFNQTVSRTGSNPTVFGTFRYQFTADSASTVLKFEDLTTLAGSNSADGLLDGVWAQAAAPTVVSPSGTGTLGTVNYLGGNLALDSDENPGTPNAAGLYPTATSSATAHGTNTAGGNDGAGKNAGFSGMHSWHAGSATTFWDVDLGDLTGQPNAGNHTYAIGSIQVYSRSDCCWDQSNGLIDLLDESGGNVFSGAVAFGNPRTNVADVLDFGSQEVFGAQVTYKNMRSFNELEVHGVPDYVQDSDDTLRIDLAPDGGSDFVYVAGDAVLGGTLQFNPAGGWTPDDGGSFDILTAASIDISALTLDLSAVPTGLTFQLGLRGGGAGQILNVALVPEPSTFALGALGLLGLVFGARRRRRS